MKAVLPFNYQMRIEFCTLLWHQTCKLHQFIIDRITQSQTTRQEKSVKQI
jgi:hypothetical protein